MAENKKATDREMVLINVLERMADQIQKQETMMQDIVKRQNEISRDVINADYRQASLMDEVVKRQSEMSKAAANAEYRQGSMIDEIVKRQSEISKGFASAESKQGAMMEEIIKRQSEISKGVASAEFSQGTMHGETGSSIKNLGDSLSRYRSDMLKLVNEQDRINKRLDDLSKLLKENAFTVETANEKLADLNESLKIQEKAVNSNYEHALKQAEIFTREMADTNRNFSKLHADTEKTLGQLHQETQRQIDKLQQDTIRRLMILDTMDTALKTLLVRTEPPEKKRFFLVRMAGWMGFFFSVKVPLAFKKVFSRQKDDSDRGT